MRALRITTLIGAGIASTACRPPTNTPTCDPNYTGGCLPIAPTSTAQPATATAPTYINFPATVTGQDIYRLDADGNSIGCENG